MDAQNFNFASQFPENEDLLFHRPKFCI